MTASLHALANGRDAGLYYVNDPQRERRPSARDDYYTADGGGIWWTTGQSVVRNNAPIDRETFRDLCAGIDPRTGKSLVRGAGAAHRAGWDFTFSAPKSVSILWMSADAERRSQIVRVHRDAVERALQLFNTERLLEARLGQGGFIREQPTDIIIGRFAHYTSREGDCNLHEHCVLINVLGCSDGKWRTAETQRAFTNLTLLGAAYRAELASGLRHLGFHLREAGRGQFEVAGLPSHLLTKFSKRSQQIEKEVGRQASTLQKAVATLATRRSKGEVPVGDALEERWKVELSETSIDPWRDAFAYQPTPSHNTSDEFALDAPAIDVRGPLSAAAADLFKHQSVITRPALLRTALVNAALGRNSVNDVLDELAALEKDGSLLRLQGDELASCWTSPTIAAREARILRAADRIDENDWVTSQILADALNDANHLSAEQKNAVRFAYNRDGIAICEAASGTGKTTIARVIVDVAHRSGLSVLGLAPTWTAADELAKSTGISSSAIAKWRHDNRSSARATLTKDTVLIVDEASMCASADLEEILGEAYSQKSKVIFLGDRRQLEAVAGGNPLKAISEITLKSATLTQVRRQHVSWQRAASIVMARGDVESGVRAYARNNRIDLVSGEQALVDRTIQRWTDLRSQHGDDVLLITRRNSDAKRLNEAARSALIREGKLSLHTVTVPCIDRDKKLSYMDIAVGDMIRFGENIPSLNIRNGTRGIIEDISVPNGAPLIRVLLDNGKRIDGPWSMFARERFGKRSTPAISFAYAGTAYSVQGRTSLAAVLMVNSATDARELYVGLTRHQKDAAVVANGDRLVSDGRRNTPSLSAAGDKTTMIEQLCAESRHYSEKSNVIDYVSSRADFIRSGVVNVAPSLPSWSLIAIANAAQKISSILQIAPNQPIALERIKRKYQMGSTSSITARFFLRIRALKNDLLSVRQAHNTTRSTNVNRDHRVR